MKKIMLFVAIVAMVSCTGSKKETQDTDPDALQTVTFHVKAFRHALLDEDGEQAESLQVSSRRAPHATILDDVNGTALTDLFVFDGTTELIHQTSTDENFGTLTLELTHGQHSLSFICTRATGISVSDGIMSFGSIRPTFGRLVNLNVTSGTNSQAIALDRLSGLLQITINDAFPASAKEIEFVINPRYSQMDVTTLQAVNSCEWSSGRSNCASKAGQSDVSYTLHTILPSMTEEMEANVTINIYGSAGTVIYSVTIQDVRLATNTKTILSGSLFTAASASILVNTSWNADIVGTW